MNWELFGVHFGILFFFGEACYILFKRLFKRLLGGVKTFICMDLEIIWTKKSEYLDEEIGVRIFRPNNLDERTLTFSSKCDSIDFRGGETFGRR